MESCRTMRTTPVKSAIWHSDTEGLKGRLKEGGGRPWKRQSNTPENHRWLFVGAMLLACSVDGAPGLFVCYRLFYAWDLWESLQRQGTSPRFTTWKGEDNWISACFFCRRHGLPTATANMKQEFCCFSTWAASMGRRVQLSFLDPPLMRQGPYGASKAALRECPRIHARRPSPSPKTTQTAQIMSLPCQKSVKADPYFRKGCKWCKDVGIGEGPPKESSTCVCFWSLISQPSLETQEGTFVSNRPHQSQSNNRLCESCCLTPPPTPSKSRGQDKWESLEERWRQVLSFLMHFGASFCRLAFKEPGCQSLKVLPAIADFLWVFEPGLALFQTWICPKLLWGLSNQKVCVEPVWPSPLSKCPGHYKRESWEESWRQVLTSLGAPFWKHLMVVRPLPNQDLRSWEPRRSKLGGTSIEHFEALLFGEKRARPLSLLLWGIVWHIFEQNMFNVFELGQAWGRRGLFDWEPLRDPWAILEQPLNFDTFWLCLSLQPFEAGVQLCEERASVPNSLKQEASTTSYMQRLFEQLTHEILCEEPWDLMTQNGTGYCSASHQTSIFTSHWQQPRVDEATLRPCDTWKGPNYWPALHRKSMVISPSSWCTTFHVQMGSAFKTWQGCFQRHKKAHLLVMSSKVRWRISITVSLHQFCVTRQGLSVTASGCTPKGVYGNTAFWCKGSEKVLDRVLGKGSQKGVCYGFYNIKGLWEGFSEQVLRRGFQTVPRTPPCSCMPP